MSVEIRPLRHPEESGRALRTFLKAMVGLPPAMLDADPAEVLEPGRYLGAVVDGAIVGGADSYTGWLVVPGGRRLPHAAVTHIGVLPTHTRRGIVTGLVSRQLEDIAARGEPVATLRASEAVIYERFGYGVASCSAEYRIARRRAVLRESVPTGGPVRLVEVGEAGELLPEIYAAAGWVGAVRRADQWWVSHRPGPGAQLAVHGPEGAEDGYLVFHPVNTAEWWSGAERTIVVDDLVAHTPEAYAGLLQYLLRVDLVDTIVLGGRPVDDPLPTLFRDRRAVTVGSIRDETWLRLVDVGAALAARSYSDAAPVTIEVTDDVLPANTGRYRLDGSRTDDPADLSLDVAALAAVYLGGTRWWQLALAGRVAEHTPGALTRADDLFATPRAPHSGTIF
ncbi:GNAT family N-acetyltransferase [Cryptosporangium minutisporangium]|uniref:GNAT family N-acetyltransferase n=1 Tax=Cryptosporangium minutisporangium TaxID=113569 RepID=A0ABP6STM7_9ACTN